MTLQTHKRTNTQTNVEKYYIDNGGYYYCVSAIYMYTVCIQFIYEYIYAYCIYIYICGLPDKCGANISKGSLVFRG